MEDRVLGTAGSVGIHHAPTSRHLSHPARHYKPRNMKLTSRKLAKTQIFKSHSEFIKREDKSINGVSEYFAKNHPDFEEQNRTNRACWNCSGCSDCYDCYDCYDCSYCFDCYDCSKESEVKGNNKNKLDIPIIENIHQKVLEIIKHNGNALDMSDWHTCDTRHCRAGWVTVLAGKKGKELEDKTSTAFAAMQIYKRSSQIRVSPAQFYTNNQAAMEDIERCAELEKKND